MAASKKKPYSRPVLTAYGSVLAMTAGSAGTKGDGKGSKQAGGGGGKGGGGKGGGKPSERFMKEKPLCIGKHKLGFGIYLYAYRPAYRDQWGHGLQVGVMVEEIEPVLPQVISYHADGYRLVDYAKLARIDGSAELDG